MRVLVTPDYRTLSRQAADLAAQAVRADPRLVLGLPTGQTPLGMYEDLVRKHRQEGLDFSRIRTFNLDEYAGLPPDHPKSYRAYMRRRFFDLVNIPIENTDIPLGAADNAFAECERYEQAIQAAGGMDLLIAGIGTNGHIAFNEPGSSFASRTRLVMLAPETVASASRYFNDETEVPRQAITTGIGTILEARHIVLVASGHGKAGAVKRALQGPVTESVPASALQLHPNVTAILDRAAAPEFFG